MIFLLGFLNCGKEVMYFLLFICFFLLLNSGKVRYFDIIELNMDWLDECCLFFNNMCVCMYFFEIFCFVSNIILMFM